MANRTKRQKAIIKRRLFIISAVIVLVAAVAGIFFAVNAIVKSFSPSGGKGNSASGDSSVTESREPYVVSTATVVNTGDILIHSPVLAGAKTSAGYDFSSLFKSAADYFKKSDLAVANLEVTLGGSESGAYSGYPAFNSPDSLLDSVKSSGINLLLTANNHSYDTGLYGMKRTVSQIKSAGLEFLGTKENDSDHSYIVRDINGIKIGMVCYTYETKCETPGRKALNGAIISTDANSLINSFSYEHIEDFYTSAQNDISAMRADGAEAVVFYMHWGEEYQLSANTWQKTIAQNLCNMGVDVIVGSHPHVIQPVSLLTSEDSTHNTVCLYSMGNSISNQRQEIMVPECTTGHTEDGVLFYYTFEKYSDGTVRLSGVDLIPTWVNKYSGGSGYLYTMYPLENPTDGADKYALTGAAASKSAASYERTKNIVAAGLTECQQYLGSSVRFPGQQ